MTKEKYPASEGDLYADQGIGFHTSSSGSEVAALYVCSASEVETGHFQTLKQCQTYIEHVVTSDTELSWKH